MSYVLRIVFESGRSRLVGTYATETEAYAALWSLDMCGIAVAHITEAEA